MTDFLLPFKRAHAPEFDPDDSRLVTDAWLERCVFDDEVPNAQDPHALLYRPLRLILPIPGKYPRQRFRYTVAPADAQSSPQKQTPCEYPTLALTNAASRIWSNCATPSVRECRKLATTYIPAWPNLISIWTQVLSANPKSQRARLLI